MMRARRPALEHSPPTLIGGSRHLMAAIVAQGANQAACSVNSAPKVRFGALPPLRGHRSVRAASAASSSGMVELGKSGLMVSPMGLGTRCWGDTAAGFGENYDEEDLSLLFEAAVTCGCNFFDTDEVYGFQSLQAGKQAEQLLGKQKRLWEHPARPDLVVATKYCPLPWANSFVGGPVRAGKESMVGALKASLERLGLEKVDLWQIQNPIDGYSREFVEGLCEAKELGLVKAIGVCNYNMQQMEEALEVAEQHGIPLASNQVRYSIFWRAPEKGMLELCQKANVSVVAHSPLDGRIAAGPEGLSSEESAVVKLMEFIGAVGYKGKTSTQIALNYLMCKGAIPIPGCTSVEHAEELLGAMGWSLEEDDIGVIDEKLTYHGF